MLVHTIKEVREQVKAWKKEGLTVGYVPTMGYLHEGHRSLIEKAVSENDRVVVSVFVNPTQFGPNEDYEDYPRDIQKDYALCTDAGANLVFNPEPEEMYFPDKCTTVNVEGLSKGLCGAKRPVHFGGVCLVVSKFLNIVTPDKAYFGEKDAQQLAIIKRMVRDLSMDVEIVGCPIVREADGLAKSSRNTYLSAEERVAALVLNRSLTKAKAAMEDGLRCVSEIRDLIESEIKEEPLAKADYIEIVDSETLQPVESVERDVLVAIAVYIGKTRLIDNFTFRLA